MKSYCTMNYYYMEQLFVSVTACNGGCCTMSDWKKFMLYYVEQIFINISI